MLFRVIGALVLAAGWAGQALAWGQEGHSIIGEVAQHRLTPQAAAAVSRLLGQGRSLASVSSWADDVRDQRPETYNWHFVDMRWRRTAISPSGIASRRRRAIASWQRSSG